MGVSSFTASVVPLETIARRRRQRGMLIAQQFDGMPEAHAAASHHPIDHRTAGLAGPEAMPQIVASGLTTSDGS